MARILALLIVVAAVTGAAAGERFPILQPDQMNADQKRLLEALLAGPRGEGNTSHEAVQKMLRGGPFNAWMRSPDLGNRLQNVGEYVRYRTSLPPRLNEFAILITAREWTSQYEWYAHYPLAMKAGLDAQVADELALGKRPSAMSGRHQSYDDPRREERWRIGLVKRTLATSVVPIHAEQCPTRVISDVLSARQPLPLCPRFQTYCCLAVRNRLWPGRARA